MRRTITFLLLFISSYSFSKTPVVSTVDQRVELIGIVFRLAGNPEYNMNFAKSYVKDINDYFGKYKDQPVVSFARKLAEEKNIGFSKVMFLAVNLEFKKNQFSLIKVSESTLKDKWDMADAVKFVVLLNDFYKVSAFNKFFKRHQEMYRIATSQFDLSSTGFDPKWYLDYYGDHDMDYRSIVGLANGGANYGPSVFPLGQKKLVYAIMGSWSFDKEGNPFYPTDQYLPILIHEFNHSFVNHILDEDGNDTLMKASGEILLDAQRAEMKREAYENWESVINESIVRACVVRYLIDHKSGDKIVQNEVLTQTNKGFLWTKELVSLLGEYESSRDKYPTFKSFYPRVIAFFNETAHNIKKP